MSKRIPEMKNNFNVVKIAHNVVNHLVMLNVSQSNYFHLKMCNMLYLPQQIAIKL